MKRNFKLFLRTFYLSAVIIFCLVFGFIGVAKAYEAIRFVGFGEYKSAIDIDRDKARFFDFEIKYNNIDNNDTM